MYCNDDADSFDITEELTFSSDEDLGDDKVFYDDASAHQRVLNLF